MKLKGVAAVLAIVLCISTVFCACSGERTVMEEIELNSTEKISAATQEPSLDIKLDKTVFQVGESAKIEIHKNNSCLGEVKAVCSNNDSFKIEGETITALAVGKAEVYFQCDNAKSQVIQVECVVYAQSISLNQEQISLKIGDKSQLTATVLPENTTDKTVSFTSGNSDVAAVDEKGQVTGVSVGTTSVTAKDSTGRIAAKCTVEVMPVEVEKVTLSDNTVKISKGQKYIISADVAPSNATYKELKWSSSDTSVAEYSNGIITAKSEGEAKLTATASNGKTDTVSVTVTKNKTSKTMYTTVVLNVRSYPSTDASIVDKLPIGRAVEIVKNGSWAMINFGSGKVGYVKSSYLSSVKPCKIDGVPYLNQFSLGYPTGCEAVSAVMVLNYHNYNVSVGQIVKALPMGEAKHQENGKWVGANPFEEFVGHPSKGLSKGSYGCFAKPLVQSMKTVAGDKVKDISGCSVDTLFDYVKKGEPVVVWCVKNGNPTKKGVTWTYPDGSGKFSELVGEHCAVLIGYDSNYVYLNDPSAGENVTQSISDFERNFKKLYSQAIVVS